MTDGNQLRIEVAANLEIAKAHILALSRQCARAICDRGISFLQMATSNSVSGQNMWSRMHEHAQKLWDRRLSVPADIPLGVLMRLPFCIFKVQDDGSEHFMEAAQTFNAASARVQTLAKLSPGEYVIYNEDTGQHASVSAYNQRAADKAHLGTP